jgi:hypothetical protein
MGQTAEARAALEKAVQLDPSGPVGQAARSALAKLK